MMVKWMAKSGSKPRGGFISLYLCNLFIKPKPRNSGQILLHLCTERWISAEDSLDPVGLQGLKLFNGFDILVDEFPDAYWTNILKLQQH